MTQPTTTRPQTTQPPTTASIAITTTVSSPRLVDCPSNGVSKVPNPFSCTRYFMCYEGVAVPRNCSPGLYFSPSRLRCVRRADSDCLLDNESCPAENDPQNVVFLPDQEDCQRFVQIFLFINLMTETCHNLQIFYMLQWPTRRVRLWRFASLGSFEQLVYSRRRL